MTTGNLYLDCFILGVLGVIAHCLIKANSLQKDADTAGVEFNIQIYVKKDKITIALSFVAVLLWLFLFEESINMYAKINDYVKISFAGVGFLGSYGLQQAFGKGKSYIRNIGKEKTND